MTPPDDAPSGYSIRVVSRMTGIPADTLRMWERRYGFPRPRRGDTGVRAYGADEVEHLQLVVRALAAGHRPGNVVALERSQLAELLARTEPAPRAAAAIPPHLGAATTLRAIVDALHRSEARTLDRLLRQSVATMGARSFLVDLAAPLAHRVGDLWHDGVLAIRHEHLVTDALTTQLKILQATYDEPRGSPGVLVATLPGEQHVLAVEMTSLYLTLQGVRVVSLGSAAPPDQILRAAQELGADAVALSLVVDVDPEQRRREVRELSAGLRRSTPVWIGGRAARRLPLDDAPVQVFSAWPELDDHLVRLRQR